MSDSQTRITVQPSAESTRVVLRSRRRFDLIFSTQYEAFVPERSFASRVLHCLPCQKSPSQKITIRAAEKTMSGFPGRLLTFLRYRSPCCQSCRRKAISGFVSLLVLLRFERELAAEAGWRPVNDGGDSIPDRIASPAGPNI